MIHIGSKKGDMLRLCQQYAYEHVHMLMEFQENVTVQCVLQTISKQQWLKSMKREM